MGWSSIWFAIVALGQGETAGTAASAEQVKHRPTTVQVGNLAAELEVEPNVVRLRFQKSEDAQIDLHSVRGMLVLGPCEDGKTYRYGLFPEASKRGDPQSLRADLDLSQQNGTTIPARIVLRGLGRHSTNSHSPVSVTTDLVVEFSSGRLAMLRQAVCPVSRLPLDAMGEPLSAEIGGQLVFVCCEPCIEVVRKEPQKYLSSVVTTSVVPSPASVTDTAAIQKQTTCPVSKKPLGSMGTPWKVRLAGEDVFVCCKHCVEALLKSSGDKK